MFRFFRAIRRELLENGKLNRYAGNALGEIVLVVAGILIDQIERELDGRIE
jgi:hypothetical protein